MRRILKTAILLGATVAIMVGGLSARAAHADRISNPIAVFAGLDKITARITAFEVPIGQTVQFGSLRVTPRICYSRPATEAPLTTAFIEVDELKLDKKIARLFTGWMFASSPGLHGVEHPVFDVWLTNCKTNEGEESPENAEKAPDIGSADSN